MTNDNVSALPLMELSLAGRRYLVWPKVDNELAGPQAALGEPAVSPHGEDPRPGQPPPVPPAPAPPPTDPMPAPIAA